ncbi:hypothetical protein OHA37_00120 [Streptomyces sp. NBC_00335]|uniref:hypothetical protein n=1 Tax=unclassified Streptomyces TaxID=2593676 RepID=UPI0022549052|nr:MULTISPECIES: hypothetical protein [unclassified Streptomyces]MCX5410173.1 hypothetical protein [Streptomyces sp. NBC_00086]
MDTSTARVTNTVTVGGGPTGVAAVQGKRARPEVRTPIRCSSPEQGTARPFRLDHRTDHRKMRSGRSAP